jgi:hypothetical protein
MLRRIVELEVGRDLGPRVSEQARVAPSRNAHRAPRTSR